MNTDMREEENVGLGKTSIESQHAVQISAQEYVNVTGWLNMPDMKLQDMQLTDQVTGHENAGYENAVHEIARYDKYRMKIDCITVQCVFLSNFKSFVCTWAC